ncbi:glycoside hydrolase family 15 protein [Pseudolysinimonas sp.]|uniref:glycoside hydrolase family 15 protein n=1 Tax=Pseudolysinimonas sp. TaxID=2680009 RepID=UPI003F7DC42B
MSASAQRRDDGYVVDLADYAALGDGRTIALVARDGRVDWLPAPRADSAPVFAALLDSRTGGFVELAPRDAFTSERRYEEGTNVLRTRFRTATGEVEMTDALSVGTGQPLPWTQLTRRVEGVRGQVPMAWRIRPGDIRSSSPVRLVTSGPTAVLRVGDSQIGVTGIAHGPAAPDSDAGELVGAFETAAGSHHLVCAVIGDGQPLHLPDPEWADGSIERTVAADRVWSDSFTTTGPWADAVRRSALALRLLVQRDDGGILAAGTTSLPESRRGGKNWDYRFAWVRDLAFSVDAMLDFGAREETHAAIAWLVGALESDGHRAPVYFRVDGSRDDGRPRRLSAPGWQGIGPVVSGNRASGQVQLGVYGEVLALLARDVRGGSVLDEGTARLIRMFADEICRRWRRPDSGMWELPRRRQHVASKMTAWQGLGAAISMAEAGALDVVEPTVDRWREQQGLIRSWVSVHGWSDARGSYLMDPRTGRLDAAVLLHARSGFDRGARMSRTVDAIRDELGSGPLVYRYSGMREEEGGFVACSFWLAEAMASLGRLDEARRQMDETVRLANDVGIYAEMVDEEGAFLGNIPQALSHLSLIQAASTIAAAEAGILR